MQPKIARTVKGMQMTPEVFISMRNHWLPQNVDWVLGSWTSVTILSRAVKSQIRPEAGTVYWTFLSSEHALRGVVSPDSGDRVERR